MNKDYAVGYCKPPTTTQFQKGKSGDPKGRRRFLPNFEDVLLRELTTLVELTEGGVHKRIMKFEFFVKSLVARALKGDASAVKQLMLHIEKLPVTAFVEFKTTQAAEKLLEEFRRRAMEYVAKQ